MKNERIDFTPALLRNHFKVTLRKIQRQKGYTLINVSGLAVGLGCCAIILLWVRNEKSFDSFHANRDSIYRLFTFPFIKGDPKTALTDRNSIVVSESMARKYFGDDEPMGKVLTMHQGRYTFTVTGVIKDVPKNSHLRFDCIIPIVNFWEWWDGSQDGWGMIMFYTYLQLQPNSSPGSVGPKIADVLNENVPQQKAGIRIPGS